MSLAVFGIDLSICTLYYAIDAELNLYFVSEPESGHMKNIGKNNNVVCTITDSRQKVTDKKIGIQLKGMVSEVSEPKELENPLTLWNSANPGIESAINSKSIQNKTIDSRVYKITPKEIKFFNEGLFGEEGTEILRF